MLKKLRWPDYLILLILAATALFVWFRIEGVLVYKWRWHIIPNYLFRFDEESGRWVTNLLMQGFFATIRVSLMAGVLALILGTILGVARCSKNLTVRMLARTYVELLRNVPPVVVIFIFYFLLSEQLIAAFNIENWARAIARSEDAWAWELLFGDMRLFPSTLSGVVVLALFESAFVGEIVRAGIQSVDRGQREAAKSIGMNGIDEMRFIVMPQALRKVLPPLANQFVSLIKDSSIVSLISVQELTYKTAAVASSTRAIFEAWITTAILYWFLCFGLSMIFSKLESSGKHGKRASRFR